MFKFTDRAAIGQPRKTADGYLVGDRFWSVCGQLVKGQRTPRKTCKVPMRLRNRQGRGAEKLEVRAFD
ncbi:MAG: hypothetical protein U5N55_10645 [Cypionkella sp.]|nr:hypothetical protein [Cypionkella sp.]